MGMQITQIRVRVIHELTRGQPCPSLSWLHPNFNIDLLKPYIKPSSFSGCSDLPSVPAPTLEEGSVPGLAIKSVLDV